MMNRAADGMPIGCPIGGDPPMDERAPAKPNDPRLQAALEEYFERSERDQSFDRETFIANHPEIAEELRRFITTEDQLRKFAAESRHDASQVSTGSFSHQTDETLAPPTSAPAIKSGQLSGKFGRYRILRALGEGAMGAVYLAQDTQLEREVALKTPQLSDNSEPELLERFYREARSAATLRHPRICPVYDVGEIDGTHYITMAYIEGRPLSDFVNPAVPQTEQQILIAVGKIAQALAEAHRRGIVHRDLKPANIMVDRQGEPVIMDFGLAQQIRPGENQRLTQTGVILGSPAYMSPEQVEGDPTKVGPAADQYGLGVILYELLTGQVPFTGSLASVLGQILSRTPTRPSRLRAGLDPRIEALCMKMLAKNPDERFPNLSAVAEQIAAIVRDRTNEPASKPPVWKTWAWAALGAAAAVALLAAVILHFRFGKAVVEIQVDDPDVEVALRGTSLIVTAPGKDEIKVDPGQNELTITHKGLKFKTAAFTLERGNNEAVKVSVTGPNVAVRQGDNKLAVIRVQTAPAENLAAGRIGIGTATTAPAGAPHPHLLVFPFDAVEARTARSDWAAYAKVSGAMTNTIGMKLVLIPPGEYRMGPYKGHLVRITRPWYSGVYLVTRGQFAQFVAATNYRTLAEDLAGGVVLVDEPTPEKWEPRQQRTWRSPGFPQEDDHPVVQIAWSDARAFCEWLSAKEDRKYRLPTEAESEYACRSGTNGRNYLGTDAEGVTKIGNVADATAKAVFPHWNDFVKSSDGYVYTSPVGRFRPNLFGLYDTIGNAGEWCSDFYAANYYEHSPVNDPAGPETGEAHVGRGGGFTHVGGARFRFWGPSSFCRPDVGFRVVCEIAATPVDSQTSPPPAK
jgi:formylglycine-generating enzyme required for sulfatase activity/predicted Ser/Thr protein kinase